MCKSISIHSLLLPKCFHAMVFASLAIPIASFASGQAPAAQSTTHPLATHKSAHPHKRSAAKKPVEVALPPAPVTPPAPELPKWPVDEPPNPAMITWNSHGLRVDAQNASLKQILQQVAASIGATVTGLDADQRIYGTYGPAPAREVLTQLLDGCGYNVLLIGDQGQDTPRKIVLADRNATDASGANSNPQGTASNEEEPDEEVPPPAPIPPMHPGGGPRSPQEMQQRLQRRLEQTQQYSNMPPN